MTKEIGRGKLTAIIGGMFSGKTTRMQEIYGDGKGVATYKSTIDTRDSDVNISKIDELQDGFFTTHGDERIPAKLFPQDNPDLVLADLVMRPEVRKVLIDEVNFAPQALLGVIDNILNQGIDVYVAGLDKTSDLEPFGIVPELMEKADIVEQMQAVCDGCAEHKATLSYTKFPKDEVIVVAGAELYGAACKEDHGRLQGESERMKDLGIEMIFPRTLGPRLEGAVRIEVGGDTIRIGKTTAVDVIAQGLRNHGSDVRVTHEDFAGNPHLKESYEDPLDAFNLSQEFFADRKYNQIVSAELMKEEFAATWSEGDPVHIEIQDVHPEMDYNYFPTRVLNGENTPENLAEYMKRQRSRDWSKALFPDLLVYIRYPRTDVMLKQIRLNLREFEKDDPEYFLTMRRLNQRWLAGAQGKYGKNILIVDNLGDFDFANDSGSKAELVKMVRENLRL